MKIFKVISVFHILWNISFIICKILYLSYHKLKIMTINVAVKPIFLMVLLTGITILLAPAETFAASNLKQIQSEATDFPNNDANTVEVHGTVAKKDSIGSYHIKGEIKNLGQETIQFVQVTGHFYDDNNQTVGVTSCCYANPTDIEAGHTATFDSFAMKDDVSSTPKSFRLSFDWQ